MKQPKSLSQQNDRIVYAALVCKPIGFSQSEEKAIFVPSGEVAGIFESKEDFEAFDKEWFQTYPDQNQLLRCVQTKVPLSSTKWRFPRYPRPPREPKNWCCYTCGRLCKYCNVLP